MKHTLIRAALLSAMILAANSVPAGLLAYYSFDSDYSLTDGTYSGSLSEAESGGATVGVTNTAGDYVFGGGAADFNSATTNEAYLGLSSAITFGNSDTYSIAFWGKRRSGTDERSGMVVGDTSNTSDFIWLTDNDTQVTGGGLRFRNSTGGSEEFTTGHDTSFHHWAVISDGTNITLYRDNTLVTSYADATGGNVSLSLAAIGHAYNATTFSMNGQIDELYIFDETLSAATVGELFTDTYGDIPEPASMILLALGGLVVSRRRVNA